MDLFKKTGFVQSGIKKDWIKTSDGYLDEYIFQLINPESIISYLIHEARRPHAADISVLVDFLTDAEIPEITSSCLKY